MSTIQRSPSRFLVDNVHLLPRGHVLDVAAGSGRNTLYLAAQGFPVHALDRSPEALLELRVTAHDPYMEQVTTELVDLESEPLPYHVFPQATYSFVRYFPRW